MIVQDSSVECSQSKTFLKIIYLLIYVSREHNRCALRT